MMFSRNTIPDPHKFPTGTQFEIDNDLLYWYTADGQVLLPSYMKTKHMRNIVRGIKDGRFCSTSGRKRELYLKAFEEELARRPWWLKLLARIVDV